MESSFSSESEGGTPVPSWTTKQEAHYREDSESHKDSFESPSLKSVDLPISLCSVETDVMPTIEMPPNIHQTLLEVEERRDSHGLDTPQPKMSAISRSTACTVIAAYKISGITSVTPKVSVTKAPYEMYQTEGSSEKPPHRVATFHDIVTSAKTMIRRNKTESTLRPNLTVMDERRASAEDKETAESSQQSPKSCLKIDSNLELPSVGRRSSTPRSTKSVTFVVSEPTSSSSSISHTSSYYSSLLSSTSTSEQDNDKKPSSTVSKRSKLKKKTKKSWPQAGSNGVESSEGRNVMTQDDDVSSTNELSLPCCGCVLL